MERRKIQALSDKGGDRLYIGVRYFIRGKQDVRVQFPSIRQIYRPVSVQGNRIRYYNSFL